MEIFKEFTFDAAHYLPNVPEDHKCRRLHGHTYRIRLYIKGPLDPTLGWVMDFADIKAAWKPLEAQLDHRCLNEVDGLSNPTAEHIAAWIWERLKPELPLLHRIELRESPTAGVVYEGGIGEG
ncbi:MAG: 6-carboxytetrahydropterin synthase QueD [Lewinellaceae bacterium]|nr:6-carboxytetrahydropterin synthase QueD [Phaeodactylibacter sp.]MCB9350918.1 6-carboxytetrahydropterin synthase QueD [Lewinellaceae bacterium]